jgi:hypothetical protein
MAALSSFLTGFPESDRVAKAKEYLATIEGRSLAAKGFCPGVGVDAEGPRQSVDRAGRWPRPARQAPFRPEMREG